MRTNWFSYPQFKLLQTVLQEIHICVYLFAGLTLHIYLKKIMFVELKTLIPTHGMQMTTMTIFDNDNDDDDDHDNHYDHVHDVNDENDDAER